MSWQCSQLGGNKANVQDVAEHLPCAGEGVVLSRGEFGCFFFFFKSCVYVTVKGCVGVVRWASSTRGRWRGGRDLWATTDPKINPRPVFPKNICAEKLVNKCFVFNL